MLAGDRLHVLGLLAHAVLGAVEFEQQRGLRFVAFELRILDAGLHLQRVEDLDARDRNAHLHRRDDGIDRRLRDLETGTRPRTWPRAMP